MTRVGAWAFVLVVLVGLGIRCARLDLRPMHNDEAVNAIRQAAAWGSEPYRYDPDEHHGPTLYYLSLIPIRLRGIASFAELDEVTLRLTPALAGVALIALLWPLRQAMGGPATVMAALLTAISPALVFYSRNFIHEMLLALFTLLLALAVWEYSCTRRVLWAVTAGVAVGFMHATKETFVLPLAATLLAIGIVARWEWGQQGWSRLRETVSLSHLGVAVLVAGLVSVTFYSSFFTHPRGPVDSMLSYLPWLRRATGDSPHIHPWYFYLERLLWFQRPRGWVWTEAWVFGLALVAGWAAWWGRGLGEIQRGWLRCLTVYTVLLTVFYSAIPYKTPWCLVGFWHGYVLLAGAGAVLLWRWLSHPVARGMMAAVGVVGALHMGWQCVQANFVRHSDWRNPYVYAQTVPDVLRLVDRVKELAMVHPDGTRMLIQVAAPRHEYWPLPWYWRAFERVGWYDRFPEDPVAPVIVSAAEWDVRWDDRSGRRWLMAGMYEIRPRVFLELYVDLNLWTRWLELRKAAEEPVEPAS